MSGPIKVSLRPASHDPVLNRDVRVLCEDVVQVCAHAVSAAPPLGWKPFVVQQAADGKPRVCLNNLPDEYLINVTCLHTRAYCKLAFQLGHELGHVFVGPHRSYWFIESVCTAISFVCLDALTDKWRCQPPFQDWGRYAPAFAKYHQETVIGGIRAVGLDPAEDIRRWIDTSLPSILVEGQFGRDEEMICAHEICKIMEAHAESLSAITRLGAASAKEKTTDFDAWHRSVSPQEAPLVGALAELFSPASLDHRCRD